MAENGQPLDPQDYPNRLIEDQFGKRRFTLNALRERIVHQFTEETFGRPDISLEWTSTAKQLAAIDEIMNYVLAADYVSISGDERIWLQNKVYRDLFRLGDLDIALQDESITEISITGAHEIAVRHGFSQLAHFDANFDPSDEFAQLLQNIVAPLGIDLKTSDPFLEVGLNLANRPVRFSLMGPPVMPFYNGQIRLHPSKPLALADLQLPTLATELLRQILVKGYGLLIVGESGTGKTTLMANLLNFISSEKAIGLVQRAHEIHPDFISPHLKDYTAIPKTEAPTSIFERQINQALDEKVAVLFMDEIQGDEGGALWRVLTEASKPQTICTFRGKSNPARLHSAISMTIRKAHRTLPQEELNHAFRECLPFIAILAEPSPNATPRLAFLGQWSDDMTLEALVIWEPNADPIRTNIQSRYSLA